MGEGIAGRRAVNRVLFSFFAAAFGFVVLTTLPATARAEVRTLKLYFVNTGEKQTFAYKRNGNFVRSELKRLNKFLRDWRREEATSIDPQLFDLLWEIYEESGAKDEIHIVSAYRSATTNKMLRRRSRGVAKQSRHIEGKAIDFFIPGVPLSTLRKLALRLHGGGVGYYPKSNSPFVHVDTGNIRHWPRMSRQQLAQVFPNGRTVHVPRDGKPLSGYAVAMAALRSGSTALAYLDSDTGVIQPNGGSSPNLPRPAPRSVILAAAGESDGRLPAARPGAFQVAALQGDAERKALDLLYAKLEAASDGLDIPRPRPAVYRDGDEPETITGQDRVALAYAAAGLSDDLVPRDKLDAVAAVNALSADRMQNSAVLEGGAPGQDEDEAVVSTFSPPRLTAKTDLFVRPVLDRTSLSELAATGRVDGAGFAKLAPPSPSDASTVYETDLTRPRKDLIVTVSR